MAINKVPFFKKVVQSSEARIGEDISHQAQCIHELNFVSSSTAIPYCIINLFDIPGAVKTLAFRITISCPCITVMNAVFRGHISVYNTLKALPLGVDVNYFISPNILTFLLAFRRLLRPQKCDLGIC